MRGLKMSKHLQNLLLQELLPSAISGDKQIQSVANALTPMLHDLSRSLPNLLIFGRLGNQTPETMLPALQRLTDARNGLKPLSNELVEQLAWQFHVDFRELAKTSEELAAMTKESILWHRLKGTPASMKMAFALFGMPVKIEENNPAIHWASYQLGFNSSVTLDDLQKIISIAKEMAPTRCKLFRIYNDAFDFRPIIWSDGQHWSDGYWSLYSGVNYPDGTGGADDDLIVSFGNKHLFQSEKYIDTPHVIGVARHVTHSAICPYVDRPIWSRSKWGEQYVKNTGFTIGELMSIHWCERITISRIWDETKWSKRKWSISDTWDRKLPTWSMFTPSIAKSQAIYSDNGVWGDINAVYGVPTATILDKPPRWSDFSYSNGEPKSHTIDILERTTQTMSIGVEPVQPLHNIDSLVTNNHSSASKPKQDETWHGNWDERQWWQWFLYSKITEEKI